MGIFRPNGYRKVRKPLPLWVKLLAVLAALGALAWGAVILFQSVWSDLSAGPTKVDLKVLWKEGNYEEILGITEFELQENPLDPVNLVFSGFSNFHLGLSQVSLEEKLKYVEASIRDLRRALLLPGVPLVPQIHYILGKAYFYRGKFYSDLAISHLKQSLDQGYSSPDTFEYLGLSYSALSKYPQANEYFKKALEISESDLLLWTLGQTNYQMGAYGEAVAYLKKVLSKTKERNLELKTRFLLGEAYTKTADYAGAEQEYLTILEKNTASADAHYFLGEVYLAQGNKEKARSEWRKAFNIDPLHFNANQRLFVKK